MLFPKSLKLTTISARETLKQTAVVVACCVVCSAFVACADVVFATLLSIFK